MSNENNNPSVQGFVFNLGDAKPAEKINRSGKLEPWKLDYWYRLGSKYLMHQIENNL